MLPNAKSKREVSQPPSFERAPSPHPHDRTTVCVSLDRALAHINTASASAQTGRPHGATFCWLHLVHIRSISRVLPNLSQTSKAERREPQPGGARRFALPISPFGLMHTHLGRARPHHYAIPTGPCPAIRCVLGYRARWWRLDSRHIVAATSDFEFRYHSHPSPVVALHISCDRRAKTGRDEAAVLGWRTQHATFRVLGTCLGPRLVDNQRRARVRNCSEHVPARRQCSSLPLPRLQVSVAPAA